MKTLNDYNFENRKVLVRCDFNVSLDDKGRVSEDFRIKQTLPTIEYLREKKARIILMSHLGEPGAKVSESLRLNPVKEKLSEFLGQTVLKAEDCIGREVEDMVLNLQSGEILLLENLRFHKEEEENDKNFAQELAKLADFYVNDAFSVCHREHASVVGVAEYLPASAGFLLQKEIKILSRVSENPQRPLVVIIGGVKLATKMGVISRFSQIADHLLFGGEVANAILIGKGLSLGRYMLNNEEIAKYVPQIDITNSKVHLPVDGIICLEESKDGYMKVEAIGAVKQEEKIFDIGPETVNIFSEIIKQAKMILWAGPLGLFEDKRFEKGTRETAINIAGNGKAFKILGGGDTIAAVNKFGLLDKFDHVSTGGGAMLEFLSGKKLPGIEVLISHEGGI